MYRAWFCLLFLHSHLHMYSRADHRCTILWDNLCFFCISFQLQSEQGFHLFLWLSACRHSNFVITCSHVFLISPSVSSPFLRKACMLLTSAHHHNLLWTLRQKPIQRCCQCQLLCQNITLGTSDSLKCADLHCANALEQHIFLPLL